VHLDEKLNQAKSIEQYTKRDKANKSIEEIIREYRLLCENSARFGEARYQLRRIKIESRLFLATNGGSLQVDIKDLKEKLRLAENSALWKAARSERATILQNVKTF
jgi:hypothetical protein